MSKLTDEQAIRKGVELAPGWVIMPFGVEFYCPWDLEGVEFKNIQPQHLAALAADLVDMVEADKHYCVYEYDDLTEIVELIPVAFGDGMGVKHLPAKPNNEAQCKGKPRRLNTIHAVVAFFEAHPELAALEDNQCN